MYCYVSTESFFPSIRSLKKYIGDEQERVLYGQCTVPVQFKTDSLSQINPRPCSIRYFSFFYFLSLKIMLAANILIFFHVKTGIYIMQNTMVRGGV